MASAPASSAPGPLEDEGTDNNSEFSVFEMGVETIAEIATASSSSTVKKLSTSARVAKVKVRGAPVAMVTFGGAVAV